MQLMFCAWPQIVLVTFVLISYRMMNSCIPQGSIELLFNISKSAMVHPTEMIGSLLSSEDIILTMSALLLF
jgi:hypothetical protein